MKLLPITISCLLFCLSLNAQNDSIHSYNLDSSGYKIYYTADKMPEPPISQEKLLELIMSKLVWPEMDTACWFDKIYFGVIVENNGTIKNTSIKIAGSFCDDSLRFEQMQNSLKKNLDEIFYSLPPWIPGEIEGKKVAVKYYIPIHVHLY